MNRLEIAILKTLLAKDSLLREGLSIYELNKALKEAKVKTNYTTVWRHIKRMVKQGLITITGKGKREAQLLAITDKGIATYLFKGKPSKEELYKISLEQNKEFYEKLKPKEAFLTKELMTKVFINALLKIKPKINLEFFDKEWFRKVWLEANLEALAEAIKKYKDEFEEAGIWATDKERMKEMEEMEKLLKSLKMGVKRFEG